MATDLELRYDRLKQQIDALYKERDGWSGPKDKMRRNSGNKSDLKYVNAKKEYDKLTAQIQAAESKAAPLKAQLDSIDKTKENKKKRISIEEQIKEKENELSLARDYGDKDSITKLEGELTALRGQVNGTTDGGEQDAPAEDYAGQSNFKSDIESKGLDITVNPDNGQSWVSGKDADSQVQQYIYISEAQFTPSPFTRPFESGAVTNKYTPATADFDAIRKRVIDDAIKSPRGLKGLFDDLRNTGVSFDQDAYNKLDTTSTSFGAALSYALNRYTKKIVQDYKLPGGASQEPISFNQYLKTELKATGGSSNTKYDEFVTKIDEAEGDLNRFFVENLGRPASDAEVKEYYKQLRAAEKKAAQITTTSEDGKRQTTTGQYRLDQNEILEMQRKVAGKALDGSDIDVILKSGGDAANLINGVMSEARNYGIALSPKDAKGYIAEQLKAGTAGDTKKLKSKILTLSKAAYSNLSDVLSEDVNLKELSGNLINNMARTLELNMDAIDVMDPTIQTALKNNGNKGTMNLTEFDKMLRNDGRWAKTSNAREEAANYAYEVLKDFGLMA